MNVYSKILTLSLLVTSLIACNKVAAPVEGEDLPVDLTGRYIHFDTGKSTRAVLVEEGVLMEDFNVLGYQYRGSWQSEQVFAKPNVFFSDANKTKGQIPLTVEYDNGIYSYSPVQTWSGNTYSFFGYYPTDNANLKLFGSNANNDDNVEEGEPYLIYSFPFSHSPLDLVDVMTAAYIDTGVASSAQVQMDFHHRLSAIDITARNYYEYDHDGDPNTESKLVTIEIVDLDLNLSNIVHQTAKIYLNPDKQIEYPDAQTKIGELEYQMVGYNIPWAPESIDIKPNTASDRAMRPIVKDPNGPNSASIVLIPQEELLEGTVALTYMMKYQADNGEWLYQHVNGETWETLPPNKDLHVYYQFQPSGMDINFSKPLLEGRRYYIELTFTSDAISVNIVSAAEWDDHKDDIGFEFE